MKGRKNKQAYKPDPVFSRTEFCHLSSLIITNKIKRPTRIEFAEGKESEQPSFQYCLVFQLPGFTAMHVAIQSRELLPHVFTLISLNMRRFIFCGTCRHQKA